MLQTIRSYYGTVKYLAKLRTLLRRAKKTNQLTDIDCYYLAIDICTCLKTVSLKEEISNPADWYTEFSFKDSDQLVAYCIDYNEITNIPSIDKTEYRYTEWLGEYFIIGSLRKKNIILFNLGNKVEQTLLARVTDKSKVSMGKRMRPVISDLVNVIDVLFDSFSIGEKS